MTQEFQWRQWKHYFEWFSKTEQTGSNKTNPIWSRTWTIYNSASNSVVDGEVICSQEIRTGYR